MIDFQSAGYVKLGAVPLCDETCRDLAAMPRKPSVMAGLSHV